MSNNIRLKVSNDLDGIFKYIYVDKAPVKRVFPYMEGDPWAIDFALFNDANNFAVSALARSCVHLPEWKKGVNVQMLWDGSIYNLFFTVIQSEKHDKSILQSSFFTNQNINRLIGLMSVNLNASSNLLPRVVGLLAIISFILSSKNYEEASRDLELFINGADYGIDVTKTPHEVAEFVSACNPELCRTFAEFTSELIRDLQGLGTPLSNVNSHHNKVEEAYVRFDSDGKSHLVAPTATEFPRIPSSLFNELLDQPVFFAVFSELMARLTRATQANLFSTLYDDTSFAGHGHTQQALVPYCRGALMVLSSTSAFGNRFDASVKKITDLEGNHILESFAGLRAMGELLTKYEPMHLPDWLK